MSVVRIEHLLVGHPWRERVRIALGARGINQLQLATRSHVTPRVLNYLLKKSTCALPPYDAAIRMASVLDVDPDVLWALSDTAKSRVELAPGCVVTTQDRLTALLRRPIGENDLCSAR